MIYNLVCPHCKKDCEIEVEVESPSDYYFDDTCSECGKKIGTFKHWRSGEELDLGVEIMNEVSEDFCGRTEFAADCAMDR